MGTRPMRDRDREGYRRPQQDRRLSPSKRGYGRRWQALRAIHLEEHPLCEDCSRDGKVTPGCDVHHIVKHNGDPALLYDIDNLMTLCKRCHAIRTSRGE